jgi:hypothetical protein
MTSKRYADALMIDNGACNPSGIAHAIIEACNEMRSEEGFAGTDALRHDPAIRLMVNQLSFLMGGKEISPVEHMKYVLLCEKLKGAK